MTTSLHLIRDLDGFLALEPAWRQLASQTAVDSPFMDWDWARLWVKHASPRTQLCIGVVRRSTDAGAEVIGILPLVIAPGPSGSRRYLRHLGLLGSGNEIESEGLDVLCAPADLSCVLKHLPELLRQTQRGWDTVYLHMLFEHSRSTAMLGSAIGHLRSAGDRFPAQIAHVMKVPEDWEGYLNSLSRHRRHDLRSGWRKLHEQHQGRALVAGVDMEAGTAFDALLHCHAQRFSSDESTFLSERAKAFHRELAQLWLPQGRVQLTLLAAGEAVIAGRYGLVHADRYWDYQSGFDPAYRKISLGHLNMAWTLQNLIRQGLQELDHLAGDLPFKRDWATHTRRYRYLEGFNPSSPRAALFLLLRKLRRMVRGQAAEQLPRGIAAAEVLRGICMEATMQG